MTDARGTGYSLWLMPEGEPRERLAGWIEQLAVRFRSEPFPPHVTLLCGVEGGEAEVLATSARVAAELRPFTIHVDSVDGRDEYFRCVFVQALEPAPLVSAHATAARAFGREPDPKYQPHLSLVYGTLEPDHKLAIAHEAGSDVDTRFDVRRLHVWRTEGTVPEWRETGVFDFGSTPQNRG